jgi:hypothetical protein
MCVLEERERKRIRQKYIDERAKKDPIVDHIVYMCALKKPEERKRDILPSNTVDYLFFG